jgi:hypothetical protein
MEIISLYTPHAYAFKALAEAAAVISRRCMV